MIPEVGPLVSDVVNIFWPSGSASPYTILEDAITCIDQKIAQALSTSFLNNIQTAYQDLTDYATFLDQSIENNDPPIDRATYMRDVIIPNCQALRNSIMDQVDSPNSTNPVALLAATAHVGQLCISLRVAYIYHHNSTIGGANMSLADLNTEKIGLDNWVANFTQAANIFTQQAQEWRQQQISQSSQYAYNKYLAESMVQLNDVACYAAGGPPPSREQSCRRNIANGFGYIEEFYSTLSNWTFTDNMLSASRSVVPLWKYMASKMLDAGTKPSPVIRVATSLLGGYIPVDLLIEQNSGSGYTYLEQNNLIDYYMGNESYGQRSDRITHFDVMEDVKGSVVGIQIERQIAGYDNDDMIPALTIGDSPYSKGVHWSASIPLAPNERIAVGATDCGTTDFASSN